MGERLPHPVARTAKLSFIMMAWCLCALALDPSLDVSQYAHTSWKIRDGFAKGDIRSIAQTPDGYLWLSTDFGLLRFDGVRAVPWQPPDGEQLPSSNIRDLLVAHDGTLWIGTLKGLASWKDGKLRQYPEVAGGLIGLFLEDREQALWFGVREASMARLCAVRYGNVECYGAGTFGAFVDPLYQDLKGNLWVGSGTGLWRWAPGPERYQFPRGVSQVIALAEDDSGVLLLATDQGLKKFVSGKFENYSLPGITGQFTPKSFLRTHGSLWVGTNQGLLHLHGEAVGIFRVIDGFSGDDVYRIFEDSEGNVWVTTNEGLDRFREYPIPTISRQQGLSNSGAWSVQATPDGSIWIGTQGGLNRWTNGQMTFYRSRNALQLNRRGDQTTLNVSGAATEIANSGLVGSFRSLGLDDAGRLWASTSDGVFYFERGRFIRAPGVSGGNIFSIAGDGRGKVWILQAQDLFRRSRDGAVQHIPWSQFGQRTGRTMLPGREPGGLWLGFWEGGVVYLKDGKVVRSYGAADRLGAGAVTQLRFGSKGAVWAATDGGLSRIKDGHIETLSSKNGLPCDQVNWSMEDNDNAVWVYMPCGLARIESSEWYAWADDPNRVVKTAIFDMSDGVRTVGVYGAMGPHVTKSSDGRIWFIPRDGVSVIDPQHLAFNKLPPPVYVEQVKADGRPYDPAQGLRLPPRVQHIDIDYTALSLVAPEKNRFRIKLEGYDRDWRDIGNRRQAFYTNLPPRNYRFRVMASNNSGVWNEAGAALEFSVLPAFYQTTWFRVLCGFGFLAFVWGIYRFRVQQLQRQFAIGFEARVNERTRIARELHDTLLQNLHGLMFQFQAVRNLMTRRPEEAMRSLDDAIDETERTIAESRDAIQGLRSEPIAKGNLAELLRATSEDLAKSEEVSPIFDLVEEGERRTLSAATKNEICRIALEILRNAYRHAHAQRIEAEVRYGEHALRLRIRDDGKGIDPKILMEGGKAGHWGMRGIRERAQRIGATLDFWSEAGAGTEAQLTVPAAVAYENSASAAGPGLFSKVRKRA